MLNVPSGTLVLFSIIALAICLCKLVVFIPQFPTYNTKVALTEDIDATQKDFLKAQKTGKPREVFSAVLKLVDLYNRSGKYETAEKILNDTLREREKNFDPGLKLILLKKLGDIYRNDSKYVEAKESYNNAIALNQIENDPRTLAQLKLKLVGLYYHQITDVSAVSLNRFLLYQKASAQLSEIESLLSTFDRNKGLRNETANYRLMFSLLAKRYEWNQ